MALTLNITPEVHRELGLIAQGNRSAAVEMLVQWYLRSQAPVIEPTPLA